MGFFHIRKFEFLLNFDWYKFCYLKYLSKNDRNIMQVEPGFLQEEKQSPKLFLSST